MVKYCPDQVAKHVYTHTLTIIPDSWADFELYYIWWISAHPTACWDPLHWNTSWLIKAESSYWSHRKQEEGGTVSQLEAVTSHREVLRILSQLGTFFWWSWHVFSSCSHEFCWSSLRCSCSQFSIRKWSLCKISQAKCGAYHSSLLVLE